MGFLEEAAGAVAAVEGVKKLDPNAGILTEGVAAIGGFEGAKAITEVSSRSAKKRRKTDQQRPGSRHSSNSVRSPFSFASSPDGRVGHSSNSSPYRRSRKLIPPDRSLG